MSSPETVYDQHVVTKLCHAQPGARVRLVNTTDATLGEEVFLVVIQDDFPKKRAARKGMPHGLYDEERPVFLLKETTWELKSAPSLSSKVVVLPNTTEVAPVPPQSELLPDRLLAPVDVIHDCLKFVCETFNTAPAPRDKEGSIRFAETHALIRRLETAVLLGSPATRFLVVDCSDVKNFDDVGSTPLLVGRNSSEKVQQLASYELLEDAAKSARRLIALHPALSCVCVLDRFARQDLEQNGGEIVLTLRLDVLQGMTSQQGTPLWTTKEMANA